MEEVMFKFKNIFRNENVDDIIQNIKDRGTVDMNYIDPVEVPKRQEPKSPLFTVGKNNDGQTCLTVGYPTSITLTLNDASVAYLIKQLAVNIDHAYNVTVTEKDNDPA
jgi:hypothetical protein